MRAGDRRAAAMQRCRAYRRRLLIARPLYARRRLRGDAPTSAAHTGHAAAQALQGMGPAPSGAVPRAGTPRHERNAQASYKLPLDGAAIDMLKRLGRKRRGHRADSGARRISRLIFAFIEYARDY